MAAQAAADGADPAGNLKLALEELSFKAALASPPHHCALNSAGDFVGTAVRPGAMRQQRAGRGGLLAAQPLPHGVAGVAEGAGGGLDAVGAGVSDEFLGQEVAVGFHAVQLEAARWHAGKALAEVGVGRSFFGVRHPRVARSCLTRCVLITLSFTPTGARSSPRFSQSVSSSFAL